MKKNQIFPLSMAVLWGLVFFSSMHEWSLAVCMGLCMGAAFGLFDSGKETVETQSDEKEPDSAGAEKKDVEPPGKHEWQGKSFTVRHLSGQETEAALKLAWKVFLGYESPVYTAEGTATFRRCLNNKEYLAGMAYYGAFNGEKLIGIIGIKPERKHICFFFVDGDYHRRGIGTAMFRHLLNAYPGETLTLNAAPYGLPFYYSLGFAAAGEERTVDGIRFTPMIYYGNRPLI